MAGGRIFGQTMKKTRYQRQFGGSGMGGAGHSKREHVLTEAELLAQRRAEYKRQRQVEGEAVDLAFGYERFDYKSAAVGETRRGWIFNMLATVSYNNKTMQCVAFVLFLCTHSHHFLICSSTDCLTCG
jgi:hypothetical protein